MRQRFKHDESYVGDPAADKDKTATEIRLQQGKGRRFVTPTIRLYRESVPAGRPQNGEYQTGNKDSGGEEEEHTQKQQQEYGQELMRQIWEKRERSEKDRRSRLEEDRTYERQGQKYYYFGREGGGAPRRDRSGHVIANRKPFAEPGPANNVTTIPVVPAAAVKREKSTLRARLTEELRQRTVEKQLASPTKRAKKAVPVQATVHAPAERNDAPARVEKGAIDPAELDNELIRINNEVSQKRQSFAQQLDLMKAEALRIKRKNMENPVEEGRRVYYYQYDGPQWDKRHHNRDYTTPEPTTETGGGEEIASVSRFVKLAGSGK